MTTMTRPLSEIDKIYAQLNKDLTASEKMRYCVSLIERTQKFVHVNDQKLTTHIRQHSTELITAAQMELNELAQKNKNL